MTDQLTLFAEPRARHTDPDTSRDAARAVAQHAGVLRTRILEEFSLGDGMTDDELIERIPDVYWPTLKSRRSELQKMGLLVPDGKRRNVRGRQMIIWRMSSD